MTRPNPERTMLASLLVGIFLTPAYPENPSVLGAPPWLSPTVERESSAVLEEMEGGPFIARLSRKPEKVLEVRSANRERVYREGADFTLDAAAGRLVFSAKPVEGLKLAQLYPPKGSPNSYPSRAGHPDQAMLYGPGRWFHDHQVEVSYTTSQGWPGVKPPSALDQLPKTASLLNGKKFLKIAVSGDSISTGLDASALARAEPNQPGYPDLVAANLQRLTGSEVRLVNFAISGTSIAFGVSDWPKLSACRPDLVIVAYGMNDVGRKDPKWFRERTAELVGKIRTDLPEAEVILVSPMLGNQEWIHTPREMFNLYRDQLKSLTGPGVALADVTAVWQAHLGNQRDLDLTGNGLNHPNDFGHRLYAWTILSTLGLNPGEPVRQTLKESNP